MKITGYALMDRIEELKEQEQSAESQFKTSLFQFESERGQKPDPRELMQIYMDCERKIAMLQEAQAAYNLRVAVQVDGLSMSLHRAVKLVGGVNRVKGQWKTAAQESQNPYLGYGAALQRDKENEYAQRQVPIEECLQRSEAASRQAAGLKRAIRAGNATEIELEIDETLFG